jgi:hypothetical protein
MLESDAVCGLIDMYDVGEYLSEIIVNVMIKFPIDLAEEISIQYKFIDVDEELLADAFEQSLEGILQIVLPAEGFPDYRFNELFNDMKFSLQISGIES